MSDLGWSTRRACVKVKTDSSAAKSIVGRRGVGRVRHLETRYLWVQETVADTVVRVEKVKGTEHPANALTKYTPADEIKKVHGRVGIRRLNRDVRDA